MAKLLVLGAALLLLDVFPGGGCSCTPSTTAGACQSTCDCNPNVNAPIKCPGTWDCNAKKLCEYSCKDVCAEDGGCPAGQACTGALCVTPRSCP